MARLTADQLAGFRRQSRPAQSQSADVSDLRRASQEAPAETASTTPLEASSKSDSAVLPPNRQQDASDSQLGPSAVLTRQTKGSKAVLHLPKPVAARLRATSDRTGYPLSRLVTAAVVASAEALRAELDGGVALLRRRPDPGREAFTFWLPASTRNALRELAQLGGISASEVAARALDSFLQHFEPTDS